MEALNVLVNNYKNTTKGLNTFGKIILAIVLAFIFINVIIAFVSVILGS